MSHKTFIIAEAGVNHNGDPETAFELVDAAAKSGADAVKFQTFKAQNLVTASAQKAAYQKNTTNPTENQIDMLRHLELPFEIQLKIARYCQEKEVQFLSTAFDFESLDFLIDKTGLEILKIPSGELTNGPFVLAHARTGKKIILSTGMTDLDEIRTALGVLAYGYLGGDSPTLSAFEEAFESDPGQQIIRDKVTLLHCTSEYPAAFEDINLLAMNSIRREFGLRVGYSDHSDGITVPIAAVALGAGVIEKHFTLDRALPGPDHKSSLEPGDLTRMVRAIREVEVSLGNGHKLPRPCELSNREAVRKSLVAKVQINKNETFTSKNITFKRPGNGRSPMDYWSILGTTSARDYDIDEQIS